MRSGHSCGADSEFGEEVFDAAPDLVADGSDGGDVQAGRVVELPVVVALARVEGASVAAAHGDDDVSGADDLVGPWFGELTGDVDANLGHRGDCCRTDLAAGLGAPGPA